MNKWAFSLLPIWTLSLCLASCLQSGPAVDGNTFTATYDDLVGTLDARIEVSGWDLDAGQTLELSYDLDIAFGRWTKEIARDHVKGAWVAWAGERLFDAEGRYHQMTNVLMSTQLTTTGVAVENDQPVIPSRAVGNIHGTPFDFAEYFPFHEKASTRGTRLSGSWKKTLDDTVPPRPVPVHLRRHPRHRQVRTEAVGLCPLPRQQRPPVFPEHELQPSLLPKAHEDDPLLQGSPHDPGG